MTNCCDTTILIVQSSVTGEWGYGPPLLERVMRYDDERTGYTTASSAKAAALRDKSIPRPVKFKTIPTEVQR